MGPNQYNAIAFGMPVAARQNTDHVITVGRPASKLKTGLLHSGLEAKLAKTLYDAHSNVFLL